MLVYKVVHKNYATSLTASGIDGRWASGGRLVIYCAESIALAFLENVVRRQGVGFNSDFKTMIIDIPGDLKIQVININDMAAGWRNFRVYNICQEHGNKWHDEMKYPILKAPSAVLPDSCNYVINANHPDFKRIKIAGITDLIPDERIEDILKSYKKR